MSSSTRIRKNTRAYETKKQDKRYRPVFGRTAPKRLVKGKVLTSLISVRRSGGQSRRSSRRSCDLAGVPASGVQGR